MTGLFARLSARVGGGDGAPSPALRPRLSSRFEHESSSSLDDHDPALEGDGVAAAGQAASPSPRPSPLAGDRPPIHEAGSGQAATRSHAEDRVPQSDGPV
ncbi:MAG: hypothetical protein QOI20_1717, partial [Acidimicrobiaceae bacterium]|nr:hypothetical protein [Acidimicrobiaceae bacterium]